MVEPGELRVSDADREAAAARLHAAVGEGRITIGELDERLGVVYAARTYADLEPPLADLPGPGAPRPGVPGPPAFRSAAVEPAPQRVHLRTGMGSVERSGDWRVPPSLLLTTKMGEIVLDLTAVRSLPDRIDVEVDIGMGEVRITLPPGATADVDGVRANWGSVSSKVPPAPGSTGPHLTIHGRAAMGSLKVRGPGTDWKALLGLRTGPNG